MKTIRSFIAIPLDPEIQRSAGRLLEKLSAPGDGIKWVPPENLHLTLKFLGEVDNTEVPQVCDVVRDVCRPYPPLELTFAGTGGFPDLQRARILYVAVDDPSKSLTELVTELDRRLAEIGFKREPRDYTPHLTLGRIKRGQRRASSDVVQRMNQHQSDELGRMRVDKVQIMASFLDNKGPTYQVMDTVTLE